MSLSLPFGGSYQGESRPTQEHAECASFQRQQSVAHTLLHSTLGTLDSLSYEGGREFENRMVVVAASPRLGTATALSSGMGEDKMTAEPQLLSSWGRAVAPGALQYKARVVSTLAVFPKVLGTGTLSLDLWPGLSMGPMWMVAMGSQA